MKDYTLKFLRMQKNLTQDELCNLVGIGRGKLSKLENGDYSNLTYPLMVKISKVLDKDIKELFFDKSEVKHGAK